MAVRFFHLHSILNYHYFLSEDNMLNMDSGTRAALAVYEPDGVYLVCIEYPDANAAIEGRLKFLSEYIPDGIISGIAQLENTQWVGTKQIDKYLMIVLDAPEMARAEEILTAGRNTIEHHLDRKLANEGK